jgi:hypothetical protein
MKGIGLMQGPNRRGCRPHARPRASDEPLAGNCPIAEAMAVKRHDSPFASKRWRGEPMRGDPL